jgi:hypothetical protein
MEEIRLPLYKIRGNNLKDQFNEVSHVKSSARLSDSKEQSFIDS